MSVRRATVLTISFPVIDVTNPPYTLSGLALTGTEVQVSKDGGAFAGVAGAITELGVTGRYTVQLSASEMDAAWVHVKVERAGVQPMDLMFGTYGGKTGSVVANGGNTTTTFKTDLSESPDNYWKDTLLVFTTGALAGQVKKISAYVSATGFVTVVAAFTGVPSASDKFSLINI